MHLGFALDSSNIDLRDISDTELDLWDTDTLSKSFVGLPVFLKKVFKTCL